MNMYNKVIPLLLIILAGSLNAREVERSQHKNHTARRQDRNRHQQQQFHHGIQSSMYQQSRPDIEDGEKHSDFMKGKSKFFGRMFSLFFLYVNRICISLPNSLWFDIQYFMNNPLYVGEHCKILSVCVNACNRLYFGIMRKGMIAFFVAVVGVVAGVVIVDWFECILIEVYIEFKID